MNPITFLVDQLMLPILDTFYAVTSSYGWAIVFLTIIIKMVLFPLTVQSYRSMKEMQKLQPKLKQIQERYKKKPEELNKQMMALYRDHKVNPLGGCLPMLVQMPFLIALYAALIGDKFKDMLMASGDSSFLFMEDLAKLGVWGDQGVHAENLLLVLIFGATTFLQQKLMTPSTASSDPRQAMMQKQMQVMMPIMITGMFLFFPVPTGVFIYLVVSNFLGMAQYGWLNYKSRLEEVAGGGSVSAVASKGPSEPQLDATEDETPKEKEKALSVVGKSQGGNSSNKSQKYKVKKSYKKKKKRK